MSQAQFAEDFGVSLPTVSNWERGTRRPSFEKMDDLCFYFDVALNYLSGKTDERGTSPKHGVEDEREAALEEDLKEVERSVRKLANKIYALTPDSRSTVFALVNHLYNREVKRGTISRYGALRWDDDIEDDEVPDVDDVE